MQLTVVTWNDQIVSIQVDGTTSVEDVKAILEAETSIPSAQQALAHGTRILQDGQTLGAAGVNDGDVLQLIPVTAAAQQGRPGQQPQQQQQQQQQASASMALNPDGSARSPAAFISTVKADPHTMSMLEQNNPRLARMIREEDISGLQEELRNLHRLRTSREDELRRQEELLNADPFNPEVQKRIEELIHQKNIEENMELALEHSPELLTSVHMLYVEMEVNGVPVKAFVDSGAQMTIMTMDFAEKCYLTRLIDKRVQGTAVGVGSSKIIGKIWQAPVKVDGNFITTSITILEQKHGPQFIFGLDNMKRHQCSIDLAANHLLFPGCNAKLPFLPEHQIPQNFSEHIDEVSPEQAEANMSNAGTSSQPAASAAAAGSGPAPAAAAHPPAAPPAPAAPPVDPKVERLMALGFPRDHCEAALRATGGNEDMAASLLFGDQMM